MKPALQALLIAPDFKMRVDILFGLKSLTIREGHRDYHEGPAMICCHLVPWAVMVQIISVRHCLLKEVTVLEYTADGFESPEDMLEGMRRFYKNMTLDSPVTVIRWGVGSAQGFLVDNRMEFKCTPERLYRKIKH